MSQVAMRSVRRKGCGVVFAEGPLVGGESVDGVEKSSEGLARRRSVIWERMEVMWMALWFVGLVVVVEFWEVGEASGVATMGARHQRGECGG